MTITKARKGDLILVERTERNSWSTAAVAEAQAEGRELPETSACYSFGVVTSATREGHVNTYRLVGASNDLESGGSGFGVRIRYLLVSAKNIDVDGVLKAVEARPVFNALDEAQAIARAFLIREWKR